MKKQSSVFSKLDNIGKMIRDYTKRENCDIHIAVKGLIFANSKFKSQKYG